MKNKGQSEYQVNSMGGENFQVLTGTSSHVGKWTALMVCDGGAEFDEVTINDNAQVTTNFTLPAGAVLPGSLITQFKLASGTVLAFNAIESVS
jgi:hypothetical protein